LGPSVRQKSDDFRDLRASVRQKSDDFRVWDPL
jgi:hypothetical protein